MTQVVIEKSRDDRLVYPAYIEVTSLRPAQEMGRMVEVGAGSVPGITALDQIALEGVGITIPRAE